MSKKDMLGPITRALVSVPQNRLAIVADIANKLAGAGGEVFHSGLAEFLRNGGPTNIGDLTVVTAPFDLKKFLGENWKNVPEEQDTASAALKEVDFSKAEFVTCLKDGEKRITGEDKLARLKAGHQIRYGATVFIGLWNDYQTHKENSVVEKLFRAKGITYIDFFGDVLLYPDGHRFVLCLYRFGVGEWVWDCHWLDRGWFADGLSAMSSQVSSETSVPQPT